jgi:hypothetical protein
VAYTRVYNPAKMLAAIDDYDLESWLSRVPYRSDMCYLLQNPLKKQPAQIREVNKESS